MSETPEKKGRSRGWLMLLGVLVLGGAAYYERDRLEPWADQHMGGLMAKLHGLGIGGASEKPAEQAAKKPPPAVPVQATQVTRGNFPVVLTGLGTVDPYNSVLVRSRVDGQIVKLNFTEGDLVQQGDILVEIDPRPYRAALEQAQAKKQQDQANLANAQRDLDRYQSLAKSDYATRQQLDTQTSQVAQLTAQIAADQAAVDNAQTQLDYTTIRAPIKGRVGFRLVDQGNIVNASSTTGIVQINQIKPISVIFTQPQDLLGEISAGLAKGPVPVTALSTDGSQTYADGQLEVFNNEVDAASGTIRLKAVFRNNDKKLWPGLSVTTRMMVKTDENVVLIPANAVLRGQAGFYTYVIGPDNKAKVANLKIARMNNDSAVVSEGVKEGDTVITAGQYRVQEGTLVAVKSGDEKTASAQ